jgi:hypothetical protein
VASRAAIHIASADCDLPSPTNGVPLEHGLQNWLAELRLSNRSQTTIDWYRDLVVGRIQPGLKRQGLETVGRVRRERG